MFDWFFHIFGLMSFRELREEEQRFNRDMRRGELLIARAMAGSLTGKWREEAMTQTEDTELLERGLPWIHEVNGEMVTCHCRECDRAAALRGQLIPLARVKDVSPEEYRQHRQECER